MKQFFAALVLICASMAALGQDFSQGRCATPTPEFRAAMFGPSNSLAGADCSSNNTNPLPQYDPGSVYEINVVVHVITNGSTGNITDAMVESQIEILNEDFLALAGTNGGDGTYTGIRFKLATEDPNGNATNGITRSNNSTWFNDGGQYYNTLNWDPNRYMNIYTNNGGGALGYVPALPSDGNGSIVGTAADRVVVLWNTFGRNAPNAPFNLGRTATHEVGHFLGLEHTFNGGCSSASQPGCYTSGDLICDTAPEQSPNYGNCSGANPNTCGDIDPVENYMDYSDDACMTKFSPEQMRRMRCTLESWRPNLGNVVGGGNQSPTASFTSSTSGLTASFTDGSSDPDGSIASRSWNFGDGNSSTATNPSHTYASSGTYTVTLTVTDNEGATDSTSAQVSVSGGNQSPTSSFSFSVSGLSASFTDGSSDPDGSIASRSWNFGDGNSSSATNPSHTYASAGTYTVTLTVTDNDGASDSSSQSVTVATTGGNELTSGVPVTGLSGAQGEWLQYYIDVPAGATNLTVTTNGGSGDGDLYVRFGSEPTTSAYDCRPYLNGNNETCSQDNPQAGRWYVGIRGYNSFSGMTLTATVDTSTGCTPYNDSITGISDNSGWQRYTVDVPACASSLDVSISGGSGDADLYVRQGSQPTQSSYDCRPYRFGNNENCSFNNPASGTWHIGLRAYSAYSNVTLTVNYN